MAITPPQMQSLLSQPFTANNFIATQSAKLAVATASVSVTFTNLSTTGRITAKITNAGGAGCYMASGAGSATAIVSSATPQPTSGDSVVSNCDYVAAGAILTQDFVENTTTFSAISSGTTVLEISVGYGQ